MGRYLGYMVVPFLGGCDTLMGSGGALNAKCLFSTLLRQLRGYSSFTDLINNQSIGVP